MTSTHRPQRRKLAWLAYLHGQRRREIEIAFSKLPPKSFARALELGAGDGFQSGLLTRYAKTLVSTDYWGPPGVDTEDRSVIYRQCDATQVADVFSGERFDLVFSSNLLEHIPDTQRVLRGILDVLAPAGFTINVMPSPLWKVFNVGLHVPNGFRAVLSLIAETRSFASVRARLSELDSPTVDNPKPRRSSRRFPLRLLIPAPHGASATNRHELLAFRRTRWIREFESAGFDVVRVMKGPLASGYGFGFASARTRLERLGVTSHFIYVARRRGESSPYERFF